MNAGFSLEDALNHLTGVHKQRAINALFSSTDAGEDDDEDDIPSESLAAVVDNVEEAGDDAEDEGDPEDPASLWKAMKLLVDSPHGYLPYSEIRTAAFDGNDEILAYYVKQDILGVRVDKVGVCLGVERREGAQC